MSVIVTEGRFRPAGADFDFKPLDEAKAGQCVDLSNDLDPYERIEALLPAPAIRIHFPSSADGRGFSIANALRRAGFRRHLRARGHVLADQYPLTLRSGFDDVEISGELAARQPEPQWSEALTRTQTGYREMLMHGDNRAGR